MWENEYVQCGARNSEKLMVSEESINSALQKLFGTNCHKYFPIQVNGSSTAAREFPFFIKCPAINHRNLNSSLTHNCS